MARQLILFTGFGMLIDTIVLFFYLNCYNVKENRRLLTFIAYILYFGVNFILGSMDIHIWIRTICNIFMIICVGYFLYERISSYEIIKEAILFIMLLGIAEFLVIPVVFLFTNSFNADIFNDPTKPHLWLVSMGLTRMIGLCLFKIYRNIKKQSYDSLDKQEVLILYLPLVISFLCFLIITKMVLEIDIFEKEDFSVLLTIIACTLVVYTIVHMIFFERYIHYRDRNQELFMLRQKDTLKYEYYKNQIESFEKMRILYHDLKNHMIISAYNSTYLKKTKETLDQFEGVFDTGCDILNILLWEKHREAVKKGIEFECIIEKVDLSFIDEMDLCSIFGNILDNAIESGSEIVNRVKPQISIRIGKINNFIIIKFKNDCISCKKKKMRDNVFATTKELKNMHGIGLSSIKRAVEKYNGHCEFDTSYDVFITEILLPIPNSH